MPCTNCLKHRKTTMIRRHREWVATARDVKAVALGCPVGHYAGSSTRHSSVATGRQQRDETAI